MPSPLDEPQIVEKPWGREVCIANWTPRLDFVVVAQSVRAAVPGKRADEKNWGADIPAWQPGPETTRAQKQNVEVRYKGKLDDQP